MKSKLLLIAGWNIIRLFLKRVTSLGRFSCSLVQFVSPKTKLHIEKNGVMKLTGRIVSEPGVYLSAKNGRLVCGKMYINRHTMIVCRDQITIEDGVTIGPNVVIYDHDHDIFHPGELKTAPVKIDKNVWIGAGCTILKGVTIGEGSVVAAGTIVTKDIPARTVVRSEVSLVYRSMDEIK